MQGWNFCVGWYIEPQASEGKRNSFHDNVKFILSSNLTMAAADSSETFLPTYLPNYTALYPRIIVFVTSTIIVNRKYLLTYSMEQSPS
jgi:hypothetical protein